MAAILEDLEIQHDDMLADPKAFAERVVNKCRELKEICVLSKSTATFTEDLKEKAATLATPKVVQQKLDELYSIIDSLPLDEQFACVDAINKFRDDVNYAIKDNVARELTRNSPTVMDRKIAHQYYIGLRDLYNNFVSTIAILDSNLAKRLPTIPALTGNFGGSSPVKHYLFIFDDNAEEEYWSPYTVIRKLGLSDKLRTLVDLLEYIDENPNCGVSYRERVL